MNFAERRELCRKQRESRSNHHQNQQRKRQAVPGNTHEKASPKPSRTSTQRNRSHGKSAAMHVSTHAENFAAILSDAKLADDSVNSSRARGNRSSALFTPCGSPITPAFRVSPITATGHCLNPSLVPVAFFSITQPCSIFRETAAAGHSSLLTSHPAANLRLRPNINSVDSAPYHRIIRCLAWRYPSNPRPFHRYRISALRIVVAPEECAR